MKVLYITHDTGPDYQNDCALLGLRQLLGDDLIDIPRVPYLYQDFPAEKAKTLYGKGFSTTRILPSDTGVDRTDIASKIARHHFDYIIWGSIWRNRMFFPEVCEHYAPERLAAIDGEDQTGILDIWPDFKIRTFKRELYVAHPGVFPIHFAIPAEKILSAPPLKTRMMAPMDPLNPATYIYQTEAEYYAQYAQSYYAATMKKAGFDALRHAEILSQWCLPYFRCLESLPALTCVPLPRRELRLIQLTWEYFGRSDNHGSQDLLIDLYGQLIDRVMKVVREHMTTEALARYVIDVIRKPTSVTPYQEVVPV